MIKYKTSMGVKYKYALTIAMLEITHNCFLLNVELLKMLVNVNLGSEAPSISLVSQQSTGAQRFPTQIQDYACWQTCTSAPLFKNYYINHYEIINIEWMFANASCENALFIFMQINQSYVTTHVMC